MTDVIREIKSMQDAEQLTEGILRGLKTGEPVFNPFKGSLVELSNGAFMFKGEPLETDQVRRAVRDHLWKNRVRFNRQIKRWAAVGGKVIDCGC
ncbi:hypothetical protein [Desulfoferrobacter suflitae]|uniref:hypothetical protein n=1 Tax=Desulfoferrobacter suflitae TaxID=2865782 RepID=UPI0021644821|nr:hypothetical protein [Desulfoferrobacter suflitae]MCK8604253.1 hypothetical protein [Desulfoferrobacter suflitae]